MMQQSIDINTMGQKAVAIALTGTHGEQVAYQLERNLFDNGHAATVLTANITHIDEAIIVVKHAGLICLCTTNTPCDLDFDTDKFSIDQIYSTQNYDQRSFLRRLSHW
jgi:bifunctional enzyme CysN/CysC